MSKAKTAAASSKAGKSLDDFKNLHDQATIVPKRIRVGLIQLGDSWEYEGEFIQRCKLKGSDLAKFRDTPDFKDHWFETGGSRSKRIWAGSKAFARKLQEKLQ